MEHGNYAPGDQMTKTTPCRGGAGRAIPWTKSLAALLLACGCLGLASSPMAASSLFSSSSSSSAKSPQSSKTSSSTTEDTTTATTPTTTPTTDSTATTTSGSTAPTAVSGTTTGTTASTSTSTPTTTDVSTTTAKTLKASDTLYLKITAPVLVQTSVSAMPATTAAAVPLPSKRIFALDKSGVLDLPYLGRFPLAGLTEEEAVLRIKAEPMLESYTVELRLLPVTQTGTDALKPFGYSLFELPPTTFAPADDIPVPEDYVLAANDTVIIQLYGTLNETYTLLVTREGVIDIPDIGPVAVAGLTYSQLKQNLSQRVNKVMIGVKSHITLGPLRSIQVFIMGDALKPGSYTVSSLSTLTNALFTGGGVTSNGSLRDIQVKRQGKVITRLDLYELLLAGDTSKDIRLKSGDVIFIPPISRTVSVEGEVRRPAIYELRKEKTLGEVVGLAGGLLPSAYPKGTQVDRVSEKEYRIIEDIDLSHPNGLQTPVRDGDAIIVPALLAKKEKIVTLSGYVKRPGAKAWRQGMKLTDMIPSKNALLTKPDLDYAVIRRHIEGARQTSVFSVRLGDALAAPASSANIELLAEDEIIVFGHEVVGDRQNKLAPLVAELERQSSGSLPALVVNVGGSVYETGAYPLESGMRISDLMRAAGGLKEEADSSLAELTRYAATPGKALEIKHLTVDLGKALAGDPEANMMLKPRDYLIVKKIPEWTDQLTVELSGEVRNPGVYPIKRGEKLSSVIKRAGGLTEVAFPQGAVFSRVEIAQKEEAQFKELADRIETELKTTIVERVDEVQRPQETADIAASIVELLRNSKSTGRMTVDLSTILAKAEDYDVTLMGGDTLFIPQIKNDVTVVGEVRRSSTHMHAKGRTVDDYLDMSGGLTEKTKRDLVYVIRADGTTMSTKSKSFFSFLELNPEGQSKPSSSDIKPGDTIVAIIDVEKVSKLKIWRDVVGSLTGIGSLLTGIANVHTAAEGKNTVNITP